MDEKNSVVGDPAPTFPFECTDPNMHSLKDLLGQNIVLYFYPKDNTPGCTIEGRDFKEIYPEFVKLNTQIIGVSRDSIACHDKFKAKLGLPYPLITDNENKLCQYFNVLSEKNLFLRTFMGIERSTFLINTQGIITQVWRNVKVKGHAQAVLEFIKNTPLG